jgi:hypothetical protein
MNKFSKLVIVLALTSTMGFGTQAFAEMGVNSSTTGSSGTGTLNAYGTGTTTGTDGMGTTGTTTGTGTYGTGTTTDTTGTYGTGTTGTGTTGYGTTSSTTPGAYGTYGTDGTGTGTTNYGTTLGNTVSNKTHHLLDRMNTYSNTNANTKGYGGNYDTYSYRANADTTTKGTNWGWLGLLGLLGLVGMRGGNRNESDIK